MGRHAIRLSKVSIVFLIGTIVITGCMEVQTAPGTDASPKPVPVSTVSIIEMDVPRTSTQPATVHAFYRAELRAKVTGYVSDVKADIGDFVEAGATMAIIDVPETRKQREIIEARIARYESEVRRAETVVELARANVHSAEARLAQSTSEAHLADASLAAMEAEFIRTQDLVRRQSLQSRILDEVRRKRDAEMARKAAMESAINAAQADVMVAQAKQISAEADVQAAEADTAIARRQLEQLDVILSYSTLKSPFTGIVTHRAVNPGDLVREGSEVGNGQPLFVVSEMATVRVQIPVPEADAALVSNGDKITLTFPSFPSEQPITTNVTRVSGDLDPDTRTMLVESEVPNPERKLIPGMFGEALISLSTKTAAKMLPARAVRYEESGAAYVYLVEDDSTVSIAPVTTGMDDGRSIEIVTGLEPGQQVIDAHLKRFTNGQLVAPLTH